MAFAAATTTVLNLDTTAVLLTPVMLALARKAGIAVIPLAMTTVWLANTASLLLPVSNLTNLLAREPGRRWRPLEFAQPDVAGAAGLDRRDHGLPLGVLLARGATRRHRYDPPLPHAAGRPGAVLGGRGWPACCSSP